MMLSHKPMIHSITDLSHSITDLRSTEETEDDNSKQLTDKQRRYSLPNKLSNMNSLDNINLPISFASRQTSKLLSLPQDNLVLITTQLIDPQHPLFSEKYKNVKLI